MGYHRAQQLARTGPLLADHHGSLPSMTGPRTEPAPSPIRWRMPIALFFLGYGLANLILSPIAERFGPRKALGLSVVAFSIATALNAPFVHPRRPGGRRLGTIHHGAADRTVRVAEHVPRLRRARVPRRSPGGHRAPPRRWAIPPGRWRRRCPALGRVSEWQLSARGGGRQQSGPSSGGVLGQLAVLPGRLSDRRVRPGSADPASATGRGGHWSL